MTYWLKLWGSGKGRYQPLPNDHLTFGRGGRPGVETGDRLVILSVGTSGKLLAVATATSGISMPGTIPEFPYRCESRLDLVCGNVDRAPLYTVIPGSEELRQWLKTSAGLRTITEPQFLAAEAAIVAAGGRAPAG